MHLLTKTTIVLASGNQGKIREIQTLLPDYQFIAQTERHVPNIPEIHTTFVENALLKARHAAQHCQLPSIADDSGLVVNALNGAPGIYSARYAGEKASDEDNIEKLLAQLKDLSQPQRQAYFVCVLVFLRDAEDPCPIIVQGRWDGYILEKPQGKNGFGYDPIFGIPHYHCSAAELSPDTKNKLSHRGQALAKLQQALSLSV
jgi:XTP/dITP diphosphohydrolase